ncbi:hypothetical protein BB561_004657 [Smittium simulii]|uniref:Uncharacterized protein n=1 Tax=Smittium simulii TaxID=133385 RepID=A0A2T9YF58_9FUNG|nr:hypothetical protein BB561_004657 [Smittium simulii]
MACYSILKRNDMPTKFKVIVIKAMIQAVATYGGELFGMSTTRCKPMQQVVDAATRILAKCVKSAAIVRLRQKLSLTDLNIKTAVARTSAFGKWSGLRTWISDLIKCPYKNQSDTEAGTSCNWMELELVYPELKTHIHYVFKIRNGTYWTARRYAKSGLIEKRFMYSMESATIRHTKQLYTNIQTSTSAYTQIIARFNSIILVGKLLGEELKLSSTEIRKNPNVLCVKTTPATAKFFSAIALPRYLMLNTIRLALIPPNQCPLGTETLHKNCCQIWLAQAEPAKTVTNPSNTNTLKVNKFVLSVESSRYINIDFRGPKEADFETASKHIQNKLALAACKILAAIVAAILPKKATIQVKVKPIYFVPGYNVLNNYSKIASKSNTVVPDPKSENSPLLNSRQCQLMAHRISGTSRRKVLEIMSWILFFSENKVSNAELDIVLCNSGV